MWGNFCDCRALHQFLLCNLLCIFGLSAQVEVEIYLYSPTATMEKIRDEFLQKITMMIFGCKAIDSYPHTEEKVGASTTKFYGHIIFPIFRARCMSKAISTPSGFIQSKQVECCTTIMQGHSSRSVPTLQSLRAFFSFRRCAETVSCNAF